MRVVFVASVVAIVLAAAAVVAGQGAAMGDAVLQPLTHDVAKELAMKITEPFAFAAVGDIITRRRVGTGDPVFYGVSNFFYQREATQDVVNPNGAPAASTGADVQTQQPDDLEALLVTARFGAGKLSEARLYPADLGLDHRPTSKWGNPTTPAPETARQILEKVQRLSKSFGTNIAIENGVGVIRVSSASTR